MFWVEVEKVEVEEEKNVITFLKLYSSLRMRDSEFFNFNPQVF